VSEHVDRQFDEVAPLVVAWMSTHGWADAELTKDAGHGAWDVESTSMIAEITVDAPPSRPNVQRLDQVSRGTEKQPVYFSARGFTSSAEEWANNVNIALFAFEKNTDEIVPGNELAEKLIEDPPSAEEQLLAAAARAVEVGQAEVKDEKTLSKADEKTRSRIEEARERKRRRKDFFS
jgi:hypothetical protein